MPPTLEYEGSAVLGRIRPRSARLGSAPRPRVVPERDDTISLHPVHLAHSRLPLPSLSRPFLPPLPLQEIQPHEVCVCVCLRLCAAVPRSEIVIKRRFLDFDRLRSFRNAIDEFGSSVFGSRFRRKNEKRTIFFFFYLLKSYVDIKIDGEYIRISFKLFILNKYCDIIG